MTCTEQQRKEYSASPTIFNPSDDGGLATLRNAERVTGSQKEVKNMNTDKWYNIMNTAGIKSMSMICEEESIRTRLALNLYDFAWDMWNASAKIDRANIS